MTTDDIQGLFDARVIVAGVTLAGLEANDALAIALGVSDSRF
jgi:hypothetical protein